MGQVPWSALQTYGFEIQLMTPWLRHRLAEEACGIYSRDLASCAMLDLHSRIRVAVCECACVPGDGICVDGVNRQLWASGRCRV